MGPTTANRRLSISGTGSSEATATAATTETAPAALGRPGPGAGPRGSVGGTRFYPSAAVAGGMAKYSTGGGGGGGDGDACELCGREDAKLTRADVAGATLQVCSDCAPHDDNARRRGGRGGGGGSDGGGGSGQGSGRGGGEPNRKKRAAQNVARAMDASGGDSKHWEEQGTDYEEDRLPYLVKGYGDVVAEAREDAGTSVEELAGAVGVDADDVRAVEEGRASRAGVGGSTVRAIEKELGVTLVDE